MNYRGMVVSQLRTVSKKRGLTLEYKGHKFTKQELIERLEQYDKEHETKAEVVNTDEEPWESEETEMVEQNTVADNQREQTKPSVTLNEIIDKYSEEKPAWVYDEVLKPGAFVVFIAHVESKKCPGDIFKKLRTAKVEAVNRKNKLVRVETLLGDMFTLGYEELLYIKADGGRYPMDIVAYLRNQRTRKGWEIINEYKEKHGQEVK